ncbi:MAG: TIGR02453 family protein, partial [Pyrinomonadaceae bacterium]
MLAKETVDFLRKLEKNNNRDWFNANKQAFIKANDNVIAMTGDLVNRIAKFDSAVAGFDPKSGIFRIYRDVRFSKDKSPYKTNLGAFIAPGGKKAMAPGYYFHVQPKMFFAAAGKH